MEENVKVQSKQQCYIVSLDNGIRSEEPVTIKVFNNFSDGTQLVELNNLVFGVYKSYSLNPKTIYIDDYDIIKSDIAELLDIDHEVTRRIVTEDRNIGVFTELNYSQNIETRISGTNMITSLVDAINKGLVTGDEAMIASDTLRLPSSSKEEPIKNKNHIKDIINIGLTSMIKKISLSKGLDISEKIKKAIRKGYIRMILFDILIGRKYRGLDYSIITDIDANNNPKWERVRFGPISVSNSIDKDAIVGDDGYFLNNHYLDREVLLQVLFESFYDEIKKMTVALNDAIRLYDDAIVRIIYNNTDVDKGKELEKLIMNSLTNIADQQKEKEAQMNAEFKINKVERTMATQSINVKVTAKLDLIQKKYPLNPKEHPELLKKAPKEEDEQVKLIVEKEKAANAGFTNMIIIIPLVALICGIGLGIAYVLLTMGSF